jgi:pSer/pThr/pTyr-binding forkhead associated (FHA) protein
MKCTQCNKENSDSAKFCRYCGAPIQQGGIKTCVNGHNYDGSLAKCPFCPSTDYEKTVRELDNQKTVLDNSAPTVGISKTDSEKTVIDYSTPKISPTAKVSADKTVLITSTPSEQIKITRKLVGWLVTYDLNPNGVDFKLYEGRNVIGRASQNDIIVNDKSVSEKHCTILYRNEKFMISDELSTNGTYVNNEIVEDKAYLNENDLIKLGNVTFKIKII